MDSDNLNYSIQTDSTQNKLTTSDSFRHSISPVVTILGGTNMIHAPAEQPDTVPIKEIAEVKKEDPDLAERFVRMAEETNEADNEVKWSVAEVNHAKAEVKKDEPNQRRRGQYIFGVIVFTVMVGTIISATITTCFGYPWFGFGELFGGLGCLKFLIWDPFAKREGQDK